MNNEILTINKMYYPEIGGVETVAKAVAEIALNVGESKVLTFNKGKNFSEETINGVKVIRLPTIFKWRSIRISPYYKSVFAKEAQIAKTIIFHFPSGQPELHPQIYKKISSKKICFYHADVDYKIVGKIYDVFVRRFLDTMDKIIVTSPNIVESSNILKDYKEKIVVIPLFVDTSHFYPRNPSKREYLLPLFSEPPEKIVLYNGRLAKYKGLEYLIEAMSMLGKQYGLVIIGRGQREKELKQLARKLGTEKRVVFLDHVQYDELPEYYSAADVFVLPSISRAEAFGLVGLEAMACGTPVITTELGTGTSYYNLHGVTGLIVSPRNSSSLAQAIKYITNNSQQCDKMIIRKRAEEFSLKIFEDKVMTLVIK
ncbi:MAG: glycosyltransferase [Pseudothermotoga sp.]